MVMVRVRVRVRVMMMMILLLMLMLVMMMMIHQSVDSLSNSSDISAAKVRSPRHMAYVGNFQFHWVTSDGERVRVGVMMMMMMLMMMMLTE